MRQVLKSRSWAWLVIALVVVLGWAAVGCNSLSTTSTAATAVPGVTTTAAGVTTTVDAGATTTSAAGVTPTTVALASSESLLPNGHIKACGIIKEVSESGGVRHLKIDYVDFLTGAAADAAAIADGIIGPGEHVDNDYYASNNNTKLRPFDVSNSVVITTYSVDMPLDVADPPFSWDECRVMWGGASGALTDAEEALKVGLWWIERAGNTIVKIDEQWVP